jgi:hypothetical protein
MRFVSILTVGALAFLGHVQAQTTGTEVTTAPPPAPTEDSVFIQCLANCDPADVDCRARCAAVPSPNQNQANATIECVANCDQGEGSEADIQAYILCRDGCINENFYTTDGTPSPTDTSDDDGDNSGDPTGTNVSPSGTGTSDDPNNSDDPNSGDVPGAASGFMLPYSVGIFGLFAAMLAL